MRFDAKVLIVADFDDAALRHAPDGLQVDRRPPAAGAVSLAVSMPPADLADVAAIVCEIDVVDEQVLDVAPKLELVISCRSNPTNVDVDACSRHGISVATTPARNADVTADLAFALLLASVRQVTASERWLRSGAWDATDHYEPYRRFRGIGLRGRTLGIVGGGAVGRRVAQRARGFGMQVLISDPFVEQEDLGDLATLTELSDMLGEADIVTIHAPLNDATIGMIGERELGMMRAGATLINAGRAAIVDESALVAALRSGHLGGGGFDVYWDEPLPADHPLLAMEHVVLTPHIGGASDDVIVEHSRQAVAALRAWAEGSPVPNVMRR
jgi:D-3-phosphoglycerate dehydrogenase / 2-oxoglutarate reductase